MVPVTRMRTETRQRMVNVTKYRTEQRSRQRSSAKEPYRQETRTRDYAVTKYRTETKTRRGTCSPVARHGNSHPRSSCHHDDHSNQDQVWFPVQKTRMEDRTREVPVTTMNTETRTRMVSQQRTRQEQRTRSVPYTEMSTETRTYAWFRNNVLVKKNVNVALPSTAAKSKDEDGSLHDHGFRNSYSYSSCHQDSYGNTHPHGSSNHDD